MFVFVNVLLAKEGQVSSSRFEEELLGQLEFQQEQQQQRRMLAEEEESIPEQQLELVGEPSIPAQLEQPEQQRRRLAEEPIPGPQQLVLVGEPTIPDSMEPTVLEPLQLERHHMMAEEESAGQGRLEEEQQRHKMAEVVDCKLGEEEVNAGQEQQGLNRKELEQNKKTWEPSWPLVDGPFVLCASWVLRRKSELEPA